jgi:hypothetical protein
VNKQATAADTVAVQPASRNCPKKATGETRLNEAEETIRSGMSETEQRIRLGIGSAAAAAAIFAPLSYKWKGVLTAVAADAILTAIYEVSPFRRLIRA